MFVYIRTCRQSGCLQRAQGSGGSDLSGASLAASCSLQQQPLAPTVSSNGDLNTFFVSPSQPINHLFGLSHTTPALSVPSAWEIIETQPQLQQNPRFSYVIIKAESCVWEHQIVERQLPVHRPISGWVSMSDGATTVVYNTVRVLRWVGSCPAAGWCCHRVCSHPASHNLLKCVLASQIAH